MTTNESHPAMRKKLARFTDDEIDIIQNSPNLSAQTLSRLLERPADSIYRKRRDLANGWIPMRDAWTAAEDEFLIATPNLTDAQQGKYIQRTTNAVSKRRYVLAKTKRIVFTPRGNLSPYQVAARPLLAKTCRVCGLLLQANWFGFNERARRWGSECSRCRPPHRSQVGQKMSSIQLAKRKAMTEPTAHRKGQPWLEVDHKILADPDYTLTEKALLLERTYAGVQRACSANGYRSHVGKGDPERDQWIIDNPNLAKVGQ